MIEFAKVNRVKKGSWEVIDTRNNNTVKKNLKTGELARAYAIYYSEEVSKATKEWEIYDKQQAALVG